MGYRAQGQYMTVKKRHGLLQFVIFLANLWLHLICDAQFMTFSETVTDTTL